MTESQQRDRVEPVKQALPHGAARFLQLADANADEVFVVDRDDRVVFVNAAAARSLGRPAAELLGQPRASLFPPHVAERQTRSLQHVFRTGETLSAEGPVVYPSGECWVSTRLSPIRNDAGEITEVLGVSRDITERKRIEDELRTSERRLHALAEAAFEGIAIHDRGVILDANSAFAELFGYEPGEIIGMNALDLTAPESRDLVRESIATGRTEPYEAVGLRKDGSRFFGEVRGRSAEYRGSQVRVTAIRDITPRKRAEEALRSSEKQLRSLFDGITEGLFRVTPEGRLLLVNRALAELLGYESPAEMMQLVGDTRTLWVEPAERERLMRVLAQEGSVRGFECQLRRKDGGILWVAVSESAERADDGALRYVEGIVQDITERRHAEAALRRADIIMKAVADGAERFLAGEDWEACVGEVLARLGRAAEVSRAYVFQNETAEDGTLLTSQRYEWCDAGVATQMANPELQRFPLVAAGFARWVELLERNEAVLGVVARFPRSEREVLEPQGIRSLAVVPVFVAGQWWGFVGYDDCAVARDWSHAEVDALRAAAGTMGAAIERQTAYAARVRSETREHAVIATANEGVLILDTSQRVLLFNPAAERMFARSAAETIGQPLHVLIPERYRSAHRDHVAEFGRGGATARAMGDHWELTGLRSDGTEFPIEVAIARSEARGETLYVALVRDVSEQKRSEEALREYSRKLDALIDNLPGFVYRCANHPDWPVEFLSEGVFEVLGYEAEDFTSGQRAFGSLIEETDRDRVWNEVQAALEARRPYVVEYRVRTAGGKQRWVWERGAGVLDGDSLVALEGFVTDITEQKLAQEQAIRTQRLGSLGQLASGIAHDLNNILAPFRLAGPLLREEIRSPDNLELLNNLEASAQRGGDLVRQILTYVRGAEGKRDPVGVRALVAEAARIAQATFPKTISLRTAVADGVADVIGDATQLHQVLLNLCVNARDAMPDGGVLTLSAENAPVDEAAAARITGVRPGGYVVFRVADTGQGMSPEVLDRAFDPFYSTKTPAVGTGLGLAMVLGIVRSHGGAVLASSEPGRGSKFDVYLPAAAGARDSRAQARVGAERGAGELVLVVDDEASIRKSLEKLLQKFGYRTLLAADGNEAVDLCAKHPEVRVVLTDLHMPGMDGVALIRALRSKRPAIHAVATTGSIEASLAAAARAAGAATVLAKPFEQGLVLHALRAVLDGYPVPQES